MGEEDGKKKEEWSLFPHHMHVSIWLVPMALIMQVKLDQKKNSYDFQHTRKILDTFLSKA